MNKQKKKGNHPEPKHKLNPPFVYANQAVFCPYCEQSAELVDSETVYGAGTDYGMFWACKPCKAWVGTHKDSRDHKPLGRLANQELRTAKKLAHAAFDPLWKAKIEREKCSKSAARKAGYKWLSKETGIEARYCHIGMLDVDQCMKVVDVCTNLKG